MSNPNIKPLGEAQWVRMALVAETEECVEAARRIVTFVKGA